MGRCGFKGGKGLTTDRATLSTILWQKLLKLLRDCTWMALKRCIPKFTILRDFRCLEPVILSSAATFIKRCGVWAVNRSCAAFRHSPHASAGSKRKDHQRAHHTALYIRRQLCRAAVRARSSGWPATKPLDKCHQDFSGAWRPVQQHQKR